MVPLHVLGFNKNRNSGGWGSGNIDSADASNLFKFGSIKVVEKDGFESWVQQQTVAEAPWAM